MDNIYTYVIDLPPGIDEMVTPCLDGYTIYLADRLDQRGRQKAFDHAMRHVWNDDFSKTNVQEIERHA